MMSWFSRAGIVAGVPEDIVAMHKEKQKKLVAVRVRGSLTQSEALVKRKLCRKLTVDI